MDTRVSRLLYPLAVKQARSGTVAAGVVLAVVGAATGGALRFHLMLAAGSLVFFSVVIVARALIPSARRWRALRGMTPEQAAESGLLHA